MRALALRAPTFGGLFNDIEREIDSLVGGAWAAPAAAYSAPVDVDEDDGGYTLSFDVPGVDRKDIIVEAKDGTLTVSGERESETGADGDRHRYRERAHGRFSRSFKLPENVGGDVTAKLDGGVLKVMVPKAPEAKPRRIEVR